MIKTPLQGKARNAIGSAQMAEFAPALFIFFLVILFPMIDLMGVAVGAATGWFGTNQAAKTVALAATPTDAQAQLVAFMKSWTNMGFSRFARLVPVGGYLGSGAHVWVTRTKFANNAIDYCGPDVLTPTGGTDAATYVYEYMVMTKQDVGPLVPVPVPFLANIPGLSKPAQITFQSFAAVEDPSQLNPAAGGGPTGSWTASPQMPGTW